MKVLTLGPAKPEHVVLFAAGAGGNPERHRPLLDHLAAHGCQVIAPCFERLVPSQASMKELQARPFGLVEALRQHGVPGIPVVAVGHSIGGWSALCLAGATPRGRDGSRITVPREPLVSRLVLYAPAAGWFEAPGALDTVTAPMLVFAGEQDDVTPMSQALHLMNAPGPVEVRVVPGAGHFSFMNVPPPGTSEDQTFDREAFLVDLANATREFITRKNHTEDPCETTASLTAGEPSPRGCASRPVGPTSRTRQE